jgi:hypothetical protein
VYTNDSLRPEPQPSSSPASTDSRAEASGAGGASASQPQPGGDDTSEARTKDEASWKSRIAEARKALERAQAFQAALESQINGLTTDFINRDDPAQRAAVAGKRDQAMAELENVKKDVDQQTKAIAEIQEEARRAGVPAGWVR